MGRKEWQSITSYMMKLSMTQFCLWAILLLLSVCALTDGKPVSSRSRTPGIVTALAMTSAEIASFAGLSASAIQKIEQMSAPSEQKSFYVGTWHIGRRAIDTTNDYLRALHIIVMERYDILLLTGLTENDHQYFQDLIRSMDHGGRTWGSLHSFQTGSDGGHIMTFVYRTDRLRLLSRQNIPETSKLIIAAAFQPISSTAVNDLLGGLRTLSPIVVVGVNRLAEEDVYPLLQLYSKLRANFYKSMYAAALQVNHLAPIILGRFNQDFWDMDLPRPDVLKPLIDLTPKQSCDMTDYPEERNAQSSSRIIAYGADLKAYPRWRSQVFFFDASLKNQDALALSSSYPVETSVMLHPTRHEETSSWAGYIGDVTKTTGRSAIRTIGSRLFS